MTDLSGKIALITGGNSGIGRATALLLASASAKIVVAGRSHERTDQVVSEVAAAGGSAWGVRCDVTDPDSCQAAVAEAQDHAGRIDILVNNAGIIHRDRTVPDTSLDEWDDTFAVNTRGTFLMSKLVLPQMIANGGGAIVNNASYFGLVGGQGAAAYCAAKGAVIALTKAMALDHARDNIRVNAVCPGSVDTPMLHKEMVEMGGVDVVKPAFEEKHPLGRIATPAEVARAVLFLVSDQSSFITGVALPVDGGITAG